MAALGVALSDASESPPVGRALWSEASAIIPIELSAGLGCVAVVRPKMTEPPSPAKIRTITNRMPTKPLFRDAGVRETTRGVFARQL
jgi:hypothetical protein